ncbi:MAG: hypothetical protein JSS25_00155 [Proteobacteria bacterium]|nr:hypothetical protein [Pseudomonadota bacterium]
MLEGAYTRLHDRAEQVRSEVPRLTPYDVLKRTEATQGSFAWGWAAPSEIGEVINSFNAWALQLHVWRLWNDVLQSYPSEDDHWEISSHFIEPVAYFCMMQPASLSERLAISAEFALHQANLYVFDGEKDELDEDKKKPGDYLKKKERIQQLQRLGSRWPRFDAFFEAHKDLNGRIYRERTKNFRNLSAHAFPPRLQFGYLHRVKREVVNPDVSGGRSVSYTMLEIPPLDFHDMQVANLEEYQKGLVAIDRFLSLIDGLCDAINARNEERQKKNAAD